MTAILVMAVLIEAVITYVKMWVVEKNIKWQTITSVLLSIAISLAYSLDIPAVVGIESPVPFVGSIITGVLVSRGSNYISDLFKTLGLKKSQTTTEVLGLDASSEVEI